MYFRVILIMVYHNNLVKKDTDVKEETRGAPTRYDDPKKKHGIWLTDPAWIWLKLAAKDEGISVGEYIERWVRSEIERDTGG